MYQMTPPQPMQPKKKKLQLWQIILIVVAVGFAAWYVYTAVAPEAATYATIQAGTLGARYSGDCVIVRDEVPYDAEGISSIDYIAQEGSLVSVSSSICNVYSTGYSTKEMTTLQNYRDSIKTYQSQLLAAETTTDAKMDQLRSDILDRAKEFRQMIAGQRGNLLNQESLLDAAVDAWQLYFKKKYSTNQRLSRLYDDEQSQLQRIDSWTKQYLATEEAIVSFYSDGYEYSLTAETYADFSPTDVRKMYQGQKPAQSTTQKAKTTIYRMVRDGSWYVLFLSKNSEWNPVDGQTYELKLERYENMQVNATVVSSTRSGGELLVRLKVEAPVTPVLYTRTCQAELGEYVQSLMVPSRAIYTYEGATGVVVLDGTNRLFIPVNVLLQDGDNVYVSALQQGLLYEGQTVALF